MNKYYLLLCCFFSFFCGWSQQEEECFGKREQAIFDLINQQRTKEGLTPFTYSAALTHGAFEQAKRDPQAPYVQLYEFSPNYTTLAYPFDLSLGRYFSAQDAVDLLFSIELRKDHFFDRVEMKFVAMGLSIVGKRLYLYLGIKHDDSAPVQHCTEPQNSEPAPYSWIRTPNILYCKVYEQEGVIAVRASDYQWGFMDTTGQMQIPTMYEGVTWFTRGLASVSTSDGQCALINHRNEVVLPFSKCKNIIPDPDFPRLVIEDENGEWLADEKGNRISEVLEEIDINGNGYYSFYVKDKKGVMDQDGKIIVAPKYGELTGFSEGFYPFELGGKWGFMDEHFRIKHAPKYTGVNVAYGFTRGLSHYEMGNKVGFIDTAYQVVLPAIYDEADAFNAQGHCMVSYKEKYGVIDRAGKFLVPAVYEYIQRDSKDNYWIAKKDNLFGILGNDNQWKLKPEFEDMYPLERNRYLVQVEGNWGVIAVHF